MHSAGFHNANQLCEDMQGVKNDITEIKEAQGTIVSSISDNKTILSQVANQMSYPQPPYFQHSNKPYAPYDSRYSFVPPHHVPPALQAKTTPPSTEQANNTSTTIPPEMISFMKAMKGHNNIV